jgi:hypothetical protein
MGENQGVIRIVVEGKEASFTATSPDVPGVSYSSRTRLSAIQSLRSHILREQATQTLMGSASAWVNAALPVVEE